MPERILIVEDNQDQMDLLCYQLRQAGYTVLTAQDGQEGLEKARKEKPDLILTDLMLPQLNGYEICALLKQDLQYQKIRIIVLSATKVEWHDAKVAKECGADAYILKTVGPQQILTTIQQVLADHA